MPLIEVGTVVALVAMAAISYFIVKSADPRSFLTPPVVAMLLVANLVPAMALLVLIARRVAMKRAARSPIGGRGRLHVRLVALFSVIATVPALMVVISASLLFQWGTEFWFSDRARTVIENADRVARIYADENKERITRDSVTMAGDVVGYVNEYGIENPLFGDGLFSQVVQRDLTEAAVVTSNLKGELRTIAMVNLDERPLEERVSPHVLTSLRSGEQCVPADKLKLLLSAPPPCVVTNAGDRFEAVVKLDPQQEVYLYVSRFVNPAAINQMNEARDAAGAYQQTLSRARTLQFRFNAILLLGSLLIVGFVIWVALTVADRLVRPVGQLVDAARRVTAGDLSARVPASEVNDEVGTLGNAFNRMTRRLEEQTGALMAANNQLESRRAFIEAVLSGVSAGIISVNQNREVRLINSSAEALLKTAKGVAVGQKLAVLAPELDRQLDSEQREDIVQLSSGGDPRTLAVKRVKVEGGYVLTFDDITDQLLDQRRAAWSDVARRIAHEIKNPLTPIQLAAERLQRRYSAEITSDPATFERLTGTIVRQVGDLRRMVDEFSSFARMPKPVFREELINEIARQALFLHEVAHPDISFTLDAPERSPVLVCDRRQLGQALTNVVKNAIEAIQHKRENGISTANERVNMVIRERGSQLCIDISDTGIGLPAERGRLTEPYMTTRAKGTGLGLAIVKKIVEEHVGSIEFEDIASGGTLVRLVFDAETLARFGGSGVDQSEEKAVNG